MAYSTTNPPQLISQTFGTQGGQPRLWSYASTDPIATVAGADYVSNGQALGMALGDVCFVLDSDTPLVSLTYVITLATTDNAVTLLSSFTTT